MSLTRLQYVKTAPQALLRLQDILADCLDDEYCSSEVDNALGYNLEEVKLDSSGEVTCVNRDREDVYNNSQIQLQVNQDLIEKDKTVCHTFATSHVQRGRLQQLNILSFKSSPTTFSTSKIIVCNSLESFHGLFNRALLRNVKKCTVAEAHGIFDKINWDVTLHQLNNLLD